MTRFRTQRDRPLSGGTTLTVRGKIDEEGELDDLARWASWDVEQARSLIRRTLYELDRTPLPRFVSEYANRYFRTGYNLSEDDGLTIWDVLEQTLAGLNGNLTLKVGTNIMPGRRLAGYVTFTSEFLSRLKPYHTTVYDLEMRQVQRYGAITISSGRVGTRNGLITLIHEATHKYAGTWDYCYFSSDGRRPRNSFHTKEKALENADSYAYFTERVGGY